jgi:hypothetical protein
MKRLLQRFALESALCIGLAARLPVIWKERHLWGRVAAPSRDKMLKHRRSV